MPLDFQILLHKGEIMQGLSYALSALGLISMICASMIKGTKFSIVLFLVFCGNMLVATSYLIGGAGINGAAACYFGGIQTLINYFYSSRNIPLPRWLIAFYAGFTIVLNIFVAGGISLLGLLVIVASLIFIVCVCQKNGTAYRFWTLINMLLWCVYDILSGSYSVLVAHVPQLIFVIAGILIYDRQAYAEKFSRLSKKTS